MGWQFHSAYSSFDSYRQIWDEINRTQGNHLLLDSKFVALILRYLGDQSILIGVSDDSNKAGLVLAVPRKRGFWQTFNPAQGPLGLILLKTPEEIEEQMMEVMESLPGHALGFSVTQQDPDYSFICKAKQCSTVEYLEYIQTPRLKLQETFEEYWRGRGKNLIHNLTRQQRRLTESGVNLELITYRDPGQVADCIERYGHLEATGWKGAAGTAIAAGNRQGLFYRAVLEDFCSRGEGVIYELVANGKTIASDLCLQRDGVCIILKTAYDESFKGSSPGLLMHERILKTLFVERIVKVLEFYGPVREWHLRWTNDVRTMYHMNFYRYKWIVATRRLIKRLSSSGRRNDFKEIAHENSCA